MPSISVCGCIFTCVSTSLSLSFYLYMSTSLFTHPSIHYPSIYSSIHVSIYQSINQSINQSIYLHLNTFTILNYLSILQLASITHKRIDKGRERFLITLQMDDIAESCPFTIFCNSFSISRRLLLSPTIIYIGSMKWNMLILI